MRSFFLRMYEKTKKGKCTAKLFNVLIRMRDTNEYKRFVLSPVYPLKFVGLLASLPRTRVFVSNRTKNESQERLFPLTSDVQLVLLHYFFLRFTQFLFTFLDELDKKVKIVIFNSFLINTIFQMN